MSNFLDAMNYRHACKQFDPDKIIPKEEFNLILEFARLSPSSFGMEQWRFKIIESSEVRQKLKRACWDQAQITDASHLIVICSITQDVKPGSAYVEQLFLRRKLPADATKIYLNKYKDHHQNEIAPHMTTYAWSAKQCYIALANMMTGAASLGIDSCPIEGFNKSDVEQVLNIDTSKEEVAVVATFGYRAGDQSIRLRQALSALVEYY